MRVHLFIFSLLVPYNVVAASYSGRWCPIACDTTLNYATFNDTNSWLSKKVRSCRSGLRATSLYLCFDEFCDDGKERDRWIREQSSWCDKHAGVTLPNYHDMVDRWKPEDRRGVKRFTADEAMKFPVLDGVVIPDARFFARAFTTMVCLRLPRVIPGRVVTKVIGSGVLGIRYTPCLRVSDKYLYIMIFS